MSQKVTCRASGCKRPPAEHGAQCSGGSDGVTCGQTWNSTTWDGKDGLGEQMSALAIIQNNLIYGPIAKAMKFIVFTVKLRSVERPSEFPDHLGASLFVDTDHREKILLTQLTLPVEGVHGLQPLIPRSLECRPK